MCCVFIDNCNVLYYHQLVFYCAKVRFFLTYTNFYAYFKKKSPMQATFFFMC